MIDTESPFGADPGATPRVDVRDLHKCYGTVQAVAGVSFQIGAGEMVGLLGPNGAGKTTTIESLIGLLKPDSGSLRICGIDVTGHRRAAKGQLGVVLQSTGWQDAITVSEAIESHGMLFNKTKSACQPLLERFGLIGKADARVGTLSGGERQRLALALALVNAPRVLVLDEPTAGLDVQMRRELHDHLRALRDEGRSVLITTHDMDEAAQLCERIVIIHGGRIVQQGTPAELVASLRAATRVQVTTDSAIDVIGLSAASGFAELRCEGMQLSFVTHDVNGALAQLLTVLAQQHVRILGLTVGKGTLEDVILRLVRDNIARDVSDTTHH